MSEDALKDAFRFQAAACEGLGAPFTAAALRAAVEEAAPWDALRPLLRPFEGADVRRLLTDAVPLRVQGALHHLVLTGAAPRLERLYAALDTAGLAGALSEALRADPTGVAAFLASPPQTNEPRRALCLVGGFLEVAAATGLPLRCLEIGASAALNQNWDLFRHRFGPDAAWGPASAALVLSADWSGPPPPTPSDVRVVEKRACDIAPIDVREEAGALRLQAYVWPDQKDRMARLRLAVETARRAGVDLTAADAAQWTRIHATPRSGVATVLYHSVFLQYPPRATREALIALVHERGAQAEAAAPFAWLRMEPDPDEPIHMEVRLTLWPGGEDRRLARVHPHGAWVRWEAAGAA